MNMWLVRHRQQIDAARPNTINRGLSSLRTYSRWAVSKGLLVENPTTDAAEVATAQVAPAGLSTIAISVAATQFPAAASLFLSC